jgi:hypothetical protein
LKTNSKQPTTQTLQTNPNTKQTQINHQPINTPNNPRHNKSTVKSRLNYGHQPGDRLVTSLVMGKQRSGDKVVTKNLWKIWKNLEKSLANLRKNLWKK